MIAVIHMKSKDKALGGRLLLKLTKENLYQDSWKDVYSLLELNRMIHG